MSQRTLSVYDFVDHFINTYTECEKIDKINVYFTIDSITRDTKFANNLIIEPQFIHIDYKEGEVLDNGVYANYDTIDYSNYGDYNSYIVLRVRENKNRSMKTIKPNNVYKLVIDCSEIKEFTSKDNKKIKYYDSSFMIANDNEIEEHKQSGSYKKSTTINHF